MGPKIPARTLCPQDLLWIDGRSGNRKPTLQHKGADPRVTCHRGLAPPGPWANMTPTDRCSAARGSAGRAEGWPL